MKEARGDANRGEFPPHCYFAEQAKVCRENSNWMNDAKVMKLHVIHLLSFVTLGRPNVCDNE